MAKCTASGFNTQPYQATACVDLHTLKWIPNATQYTVGFDIKLLFFFNLLGYSKAFIFGLKNHLNHLHLSMLNCSILKKKNIQQDKGELLCLNIYG